MKDDQKMVETIRAILNRGNDAQVQRKGNGYIILEVKKTKKYEAPC